MEYIVLPSRVKENIILQSPQDISGYVVTVYTENLSARLLENREIQFYNSSNEVIFAMASPYMYDSAGELSEDIAVEMVSKGSGCYYIAMTPDAQWLGDENRVYPVVIDPQVTTDTTRTNIIDNYVLQGAGNQNRNLDRLYIGNRPEGLTRAFIKFNTMPTLPEEAAITNATMTVWLTSGSDTGCTANAYKVTGGDWASGTITWANQPATNLLLASNISHNNFTKYSFSCLAAVQSWYNGSTTGKNANYGVMMCYSNQYVDDYNAFYSADYTNEAKRPAIVINYQDTTIDIDVGSTYTCAAPSATGTITWASSDTSIATVNSSGKVTGVKIGFATVTASVGGVVRATYNVYVTLADGVYYMGSSTGLYMAVDGGLNTGTPVKMLSKQTQGAAKLRQLWKIEYVEGGYYFIRSLYLATRALQVTSNTANITSISTSTNPFAASLGCRWIIETNSSGYIFKHRQSSTSTSSQCLRPSDTDVVTSHYVSGNSLFTWTLIKDTTITDRVLLLNPSTALPYSNYEQYIIYGKAYTLSALKIEPSFISQSSNAQNIYIDEEEESGIVSLNDSATTLTGIASGETTIYVKSENSSKYASFKLIVIGPDQYSKGVRIATVGGKQYYDYTIPIDNVFEECVEQCRKNRCMNWTQYAVDQVPFEPEIPDFFLMQATSFLWFYLKVKKGEEWDIKLEEPWRETIPGIPYLGDNGQFVFRGRVESSADLGNIMYGYTGSATGFGESTLYWGGGIADDGDIFSEEAKNPPYYSESEEDHEHIELGIQLFHADYPDYPEVGFDGVPTDSNWLDEFASILFGGS